MRCSKASASKVARLRLVVSLQRQQGQQSMSRLEMAARVNGVTRGHSPPPCAPSAPYRHWTPVARRSILLDGRTAVRDQRRMRRVSGGGERESKAKSEANDELAISLRQRNPARQTHNQMN